jgi:hypothetical protein
MSMSPHEQVHQILHCNHLARSGDPAYAEILIWWILGRDQVECHCGDASKMK